MIRELITNPRTVKDLLILFASFNRDPDDFVNFCLSEPAKSTKCNLEVLISVIPLIYFFLYLRIEKKQLLVGYLT